MNSFLPPTKYPPIQVSNIFLTKATAFCSHCPQAGPLKFLCVSPPDVPSLNFGLWGTSVDRNINKTFSWIQVRSESKWILTSVHGTNLWSGILHRQGSWSRSILSRKKQNGQYVGIIKKRKQKTNIFDHLNLYTFLSALLCLFRLQLVPFIFLFRLFGLCNLKTSKYKSKIFDSYTP